MWCCFDGVFNLKNKNKFDKLFDDASRFIPSLRSFYKDKDNDFLYEHILYDLSRKGKDLYVNMGCGSNILNNYINVDKYGDCDIKMNLEVLPLPFNDNQCKEILLINVLEHLWVKPFDFMMEIHRILKKGGVVKIEVPFLASQVNHVKSFYSIRYFNHLCSNKKISSYQHKNYFKINIAKYRFYFVKKFPYLRIHLYFELEKI